MPSEHLPVPVGPIELRIYVIGGQKVMIDADLAELYQLPTGTLNQAVRRNANRFPKDFMFQLTAEELKNWMSQIVISNPTAKMGSAQTAVRLHGTRSGYALIHAEERAFRTDEHPHDASFRQAPRTPRYSQGPRP
jgi:hypothetical protein